MNNESVVFECLEPYIEHQLKYRKFSLIYNFLNRFNNLSHFITLGLGIVGAFYLDFIGVQFSMSNYVLTLIAVNITLSILIILIRELITFMYGLKYGDEFKKYITIPESDLKNIVDRVTKNKEMKEEFDKIIKTIKYRNSLAYLFVTAGLDRRIISNLIALEIKYKNKNNR